jgi:hypothetical protein
MARERFANVSPRDARVQWRFAREALRSPELGVSRFTYDPGARMPWGHRHRAQEEVYVVVAGFGRADRSRNRVRCATAAAKSSGLPLLACKRQSAKRVPWAMSNPSPIDPGARI